MAFDLTDYRTVPQRIADFREKYPEGTLQPADLANPYRIETIGNRTFIVYVAAAYRTPDDPRPGIGAAYEPFPGPSPYTRDSELQNAETSAWGRAIIAVGASDARNIASQEDVQNRRAADEFEQATPAPPRMTASQQTALSEGLEHLLPEAATKLADYWKRQEYPSLKSGRLSREQADDVLAFMRLVQEEAEIEKAAS